MNTRKLKIENNFWTFNKFEMGDANYKKSVLIQNETDIRLYLHVKTFVVFIWTADDVLYPDAHSLCFTSSNFH